MTCKMEEHETFRRIRAFHESCESHACNSSRCLERAPRRRSKTNRQQSEQARTKAQTEDQETFRLGPRFNLFPLVQSLFANLAGDFSERQALPDDLTNAGIETLCISHLPVVEAKRLFIDVAKQMEWLNADVSAVQLAFHQRPEIFHAVRVDIAICVFDGVIDDRVLEVLGQSVVGLQFIREDRRASFDMLTHLLLQFVFAAIVYDERSDVAAPFHEAHNYGLILSSSAGDNTLALRLVHVPRFSANESFVNLDFTAELPACTFILHGEPDALKHEPRRLLTNANCAMQFITAHAVLAICQLPHRQQPLIESDRRVLKDRPDFDRELRFRMPRLALPYLAGLQEADILRAARRAHDAILPAPGRKKRDAVCRIGEVNDCFLEGFRFCCHDESSIIGVA